MGREGIRQPGNGVAAAAAAAVVVVDIGGGGGAAAAVVHIGVGEVTAAVTIAVVVAPM